MLRPHIRVLSKVAIFGVLAFSALGHVGSAGATTGPTKFLADSHYKVPSGLAGRFIGQYTLKSAATGARLSGGAMGIEVNEHGFLYGVGQFYGYDAQGHQSTWTATLYNFRQSKSQVMTYDLLGPGGSALLGRIAVTRAKSGDLAGQVTFPNGHFAIQWHKISSH
ncbi:MAG: hypothetical protein JWO59_3518 [Chloroflexi bacterium]|nr:hypothetical protein [Chloroflexota bacterium]MDB5078007.1 hypothetical protein [Chloroflexota bacterium]